MPRRTRRSLYGSVGKNRHGNWIARYPDPSSARTPAGRRRVLSQAVASKKEGEDLLRRLRKAAQEGLLRTKPLDCPYTVGEATQAYMRSCTAAGRQQGTLEQYGYSLLAFERLGLADRPVSQLTADDVERFMRARCRQVGASALSRDRSLLSSVCRRLVMRGDLERNPVELVPAPRRSKNAPRVFEQEQITKFFKELSPELRPLAVCGFYTAMRSQDLKALKWCDVGFGPKTIYVPNLKTQKGRPIPLHPDLAGVLQALLATRAEKLGRLPKPSEHVFLSRYGKPWRCFKTAWAGALKRAGLEGLRLTPHSMRSTLATYWEGQDRDLQGMVGWADLKTTQIYRHARDERTRASVNRLHFGT